MQRQRLAIEALVSVLAVESPGVGIQIPCAEEIHSQIQVVLFAGEKKLGSRSAERGIWRVQIGRFKIPTGGVTFGEADERAVNVVVVGFQQLAARITDAADGA